MSYQGIVFDRKSKQSLSGIAVSDGRNITVTGEDGRFTLDGWERCHIIFLCALTLHHNDWFIPTDGHEGDYEFSVTLVKVGTNFSFLIQPSPRLRSHPQRHQC